MLCHLSTGISQGKESCDTQSREGTCDEHVMFELLPCASIVNEWLDFNVPHPRMPLHA